MDNKSAQSLSQQLNPSDIKNREFRKSLRGYDTREVVEFLDQVARVWEKVQRNERQLVKKVEALTEELERWRSREEELNELREKALEEAEAIRNQASKDAARMIQEVEDRASGVRAQTEAWLERVIADLEETQRRKISFMTAFRASLDSHYELLKQEQENPEPLHEQLTQVLRQKDKPEATGKPI